MKKRKNHNIQKRCQRIAQAGIRNLAVIYTTSTKGCVLFDHKNQHIIKATETLVGALGYPYRWTGFLAVLCHNRVKGDYMRGLVVKTQERHFHGDLADVFTEHHADLIDSCNQNDMQTVAWIASPNGIEFTEKEAGEIFERLEAWG